MKMSKGSRENLDPDDTTAIENQSTRSENQNLLFKKYKKICKIGEGAYGIVIKCRNLDNNQIVAIKRFTGTDDDPIIRKIAIREIKTLRKNHHYNLVFQFIDNTLLHEMEATPRRLTRPRIRNVLAQIISGTKFCHQAGIIHRDIKPENILVSNDFHVKLCDFGFSRFMATGVEYTDYVATRWYRAPELLVGDTHYGPAVDVWAIGCVFAEMLVNVPLWPGRSDLDQLYLITRNLGNLSPSQQKCFENNIFFSGLEMPKSMSVEPFDTRFSQLDPPLTLKESEILRLTLCLEPSDRISCRKLLTKTYFKEEKKHSPTSSYNSKSTTSLNRDTTPKKLTPRTSQNEDSSPDEVKSPPNFNTPSTRHKDGRTVKYIKNSLHQAPMSFSMHTPIPSYNRLTKKSLSQRDITEDNNTSSKD